MVGIVAGFYVASASGARMRSLSEVRAVPGGGLEGDRCFHRTGTFTGSRTRGGEITLMALEALDAIARESGIAIEPADARRNIVTRGLARQDFVGCELCVGAATLRATRVSEPCRHLARRTDERLLKSLVHRSGLQAKILDECLIRLGDPILVS